MMASNEIQSTILLELQERILPNSGRIVGSNTLLLDTDNDGVSSGYSIDVLKKYGDIQVEGAIRIYWDKFLAVHELISRDAPYPTTKLPKWEMSAFFIPISDLDPDAPREGILIRAASEIARAINSLCESFEKYGSKFLLKHSSVKGMFEYLEELPPNRPGTWRTTLEFLLRETLFGSSDACRNLPLRDLDQLTGYERHQRVWLATNRCQ